MRETEYVGRGWVAIMKKSDYGRPHCESAIGADSKELRASAIWTSGGRAFQVEGQCRA